MVPYETRLATGGVQDIMPFKDTQHSLEYFFAKASVQDEPAVKKHLRIFGPIINYPFSG